MATDINTRRKNWQTGYELAKKHIDQFDTALDIGCDIFGWSNLMTQDFAHVHAFDFRDRTEFLNNKKIQFHQVGLGEATTTRYTKRGVGRIKANETATKTCDMPVKITTVDSFDFTNVGLIKVDCDGYEKLVLQGAKQLLTQQSPVIFCELHTSDTNSSHDYLLSLGYSHEETWYDDHGIAHDAVYIRDKK